MEEATSRKVEVWRQGLGEKQITGAADGRELVVMVKGERGAHRGAYKESISQGHCLGNQEGLIFMCFCNQQGLKDYSFKG